MNNFGRNFRISIFGESHGHKIGLVIDGIPSGIQLSSEDFAYDLSRRKSGKPGTTPRVEGDLPEIVSGVYNGYTTELLYAYYSATTTPDLLTIPILRTDQDPAMPILYRYLNEEDMWTLGAVGITREELP